MLVKRWLGDPECREPASPDRLPVHRSESPTGYSSAGCSPAEPASASPVLTILAQSRSGEAIKCAAQPPRKDAVQALASRLVMRPCRARRVRRQPECHLYFARRVSFLSCADITCRRPIKMAPLRRFGMTLSRAVTTPAFGAVRASFWLRHQQ
jgi:hypothetical protein